MVAENIRAKGMGLPKPVEAQMLPSQVLDTGSRVTKSGLHFWISVLLNPIFSVRMFNLCQYILNIYIYMAHS